jgi:hypothetical protein
MMTPPLKTIEETVAFWRTRREEAKARRELIRDWNEAHLEEEARQITALRAREVEERPRLLETIDVLTAQLFERFQQVLPRSPDASHWHIGYLSPVNKYLYMRVDGSYTLGFNGSDEYHFTSLNNSGLRRFIGTLHERAIVLDERIEEMAAEAAEQAK